MILKRISKAAGVDSICGEERAATAQPRHDRDPPRDYPQSDERGRAGVIVWRHPPAARAGRGAR